MLATVCALAVSFAPQHGRVVPNSVAIGRSAHPAMGPLDDIASKLPGPLAELLSGPPPDIDNMPPRGVVITGRRQWCRLGVRGFVHEAWALCRHLRYPGPAGRRRRSRGEACGSSSAKVFGCVCDVSKAESVEELGKFAKESLGTIHYWINNAGINGGRRPFTTLSTGTLEAVVNVNLIGVLLCTKVALDIMQQQAGVTSHIFNTVGSGVKGGGTLGTSRTARPSAACRSSPIRSSRS